MKEKIFTLLLAMIMLMPAMAQEVEDPGWSLNEETGELRIWKNFDNFTNNSKNAWLASKDLIKSVVIENGVTKIADYSFYNCEHITSVVIPNSVTTIGDRAFRECNGLTSVEIPNGVASIGNEAFYLCNGLTSVEIPNSVISIGAYAFSRCNILTSVKIPNSVTSIGIYAFNGCRGLTSIELSNSVTSISIATFSTCVSLKTIVIPNSVTSIEYWSFNGCDGLTSVVIPNSITSIDSYAFNNCNNLKTIYTDKEDPAILKSALETSKKTYTYIVPCIFSDELVAKYTAAGLTVKKEWHNFTDYVYNEDASLEADGTETAVCDRDGCEATDTRVAEGTKLLPTGVEDVVAEKAKVVKTVENGRIVIIKDGKKYGVTGQILK